ncbi:hypothetical protein NL676_004971 [Syzygium grande]|nr:hypothetical protein NL676_004971 [Syzygium grande]
MVTWSNPMSRASLRGHKWAMGVSATKAGLGVKLWVGRDGGERDGEGEVVDKGGARPVDGGAALAMGGDVPKGLWLSHSSSQKLVGAVIQRARLVDGGWGGVRWWCTVACKCKNSGGVKLRA